jgi:hypothetical protein
MNFKEVIKLREVQPDDLLVDVIVAEVESVNVRTVLSLTSASLPLQRYNVSDCFWLVRIDLTVYLTPCLSHPCAVARSSEADSED